MFEKGIRLQKKLCLQKGFGNTKVLTKCFFKFWIPNNLKSYDINFKGSSFRIYCCHVRC